MKAAKFKLALNSDPTLDCDYNFEDNGTMMVLVSGFVLGTL